MATGSCSNCGARLSPDIGWCGQCYSPVATRSAPGPATESGAAPTSAVRTLVAPEPHPAPRAEMEPPVDVDLQLALLRSGAHPVARSAVGQWLGLLVAVAIVAELAFSFLHGVALVLVALVFAVSAAGMVRAFWLRARTALGDR